MKLLVVLLSCASALLAEIHTYTLKESVTRALTQSPEVIMARYDEMKAAAYVGQVRDPFATKLVAGSGLAYTSGFPMSIEGSSPSIVQVQAIQTLYNRALSFQVASARENARGAGIDNAARRDEVIHRVATLHLAAARSTRISELLSQQVASFGRIAETVRARVQEGRELPIEARAADLRILQARQRLSTVEAERDQNETSLAVLLGFSADDRVKPAQEDMRVFQMPASETETAEEAVTNSRELRKMESAVQSKQLEAKGARSSRYPTIDLVAQYALMARFNNYDDYFRRFERNNGQLGMSFRIPLFAGAASKSQAVQADLEVSRIRVQMNATRERIVADAHKGWQDLQSAQQAREVARMDLDITRERLGVMLAQFEEGRAQLRQVEELRSAESEKWLTFLDAQTAIERAQLQILHQTGNIVAAIQ